MSNLWVGFLCMFVMLAAAGCGLGAEAATPSLSLGETAASSGVNQEDGNEGHDYYGELISAARECIVNKALQIPAGYDFSIAILTTGAYGVRGYLIKDIDGDGVDELVFGENGTDPEGPWDSIVFDIYTISDGKLVHVLDGWERNRYFFCENGMIANEGSSGAGNSSYSYFTCQDPGLHLVESVIYDGIRDGGPWFYSTVSEYDAENAEPISEERAMEIRGKYVYEHLEFIPFEEDD